MLLCISKFFLSKKPLKHEYTFREIPDLKSSAGGSFSAFSFLLVTYSAELFTIFEYHLLLFRMEFVSGLGASILRMDMALPIAGEASQKMEVICGVWTLALIFSQFALYHYRSGTP